MTIRDDIGGKDLSPLDALKSKVLCIGGWPGENAYRMDHFPYKERMAISIHPYGERQLDEMYR